MHVQPPHLACLNLPLTPRDPQDQVHSPWTAILSHPTCHGSQLHLSSEPGMSVSSPSAMAPKLG